MTMQGRLTYAVAVTTFFLCITQYIHPHTVPFVQGHAVDNVQVPFVEATLDTDGLGLLYSQMSAASSSSAYLKNKRIRKLNFDVRKASSNGDRPCPYSPRSLPAALPSPLPPAHALSERAARLAA